MAARANALAMRMFRAKLKEGIYRNEKAREQQTLSIASTQSSHGPVIQSLVKEDFLLKDLRKLGRAYGDRRSAPSIVA